MIFGGGVWPVVQRELRAAARWPLGPWLRMGGALCGVITFYYVTVGVPYSMAGEQLFIGIHLVLLFLICTVVPALTADCIARERREGTLGLLFMTPLSSPGIVLGKVLAQTLRAVTLWVAVLPLLTIPFLYGGITWRDVAGYLIIELCAGMLCLAAGLMASCLTENRSIAFIGAFLLTAGFMVEMRDRLDLRSLIPTTVLMQTIGFNTFVYRNGVAVSISGFLPSAPMPARNLAEDLFIVVLVLWAALRLAGWCVERSWQDKIPSVRRQNLVKRYCSPLFARWMAGRMRSTKEWNPIAWLQQYSWKSRLAKWGLCLLFVLLECAVIDGNQPYVLGTLMSALLVVLAAAYTYAGVNGFFQEKRSGALELILVSPLSVKQIVFGRVWGLWKQFLPAVIVVVGSDLAVHAMLSDGFGHYSYDQPDRIWLWIKDTEIVAIYLTLPVIATCFALSARNLFVASVLAATAGFGPALVLLIIPGNKQVNMDTVQLGLVEFFYLPCIMAAHTWVAWQAYRHLCRSLARRSYAS